MRLKWSLFTKNIQPHPQLRKKLQQKVSKLEVHLAHFPEDACHLNVQLDRHSRKRIFGASLTLRLPSNILRTEKSAEDPIPAFDQAIRAILRELAGLKSSLRHEQEWKTSSRQPALK